MFPNFSNRKHSKKIINTFLPTDKDQERNNEEVDEDMGKGFKKLRVKGNLKN